MNRVFPILGVTALLAAGVYGGYQVAEMQGEPAQVLKLDPKAQEASTQATAATVTQNTSAQTSAAQTSVEPAYDDGTARTESELNTASVVKNSSDGLVFIETTSQVAPNEQQQMLEQLFGMQGQTQPREARGLGSGFFVTDSGDIITNFHVVENASEINIRLHGDARAYPAKVIGTAPDYDLALIRADELPQGGVKPLPLGDDKQLEVGLKAIALGAPFGLDFSVSEGIISSLEREAPVGVSNVPQSVIQTDAAINPGNSGGPLLNSAGQVVGVNTQILTGGVQQSAGVGFAIPVSVVKQLLPQLQAGEEVTTPLLGISMFELSGADPTQLEEYGLPETGVLITRVYPGSPAQRAGLRAAEPQERPDGAVAPRPDSDVITAVEGREVDSADDVKGALIGKRPGDQVAMTVQRGEETVNVNIELTDFRFN